MTDDSLNEFSEQDELPTIRGLRPGDKVLRKFILQKCLGRGGMGEVWLARDELLGEDIALKLLPNIVRADDQAIEDLKNETRSGRGLSHPNIVRVFDFHQDDQNTGIAMEYVDGEPLSRLRTRQPQGVFSPQDITAWTLHFAGALDYAHRSNVVHRDLKPSNLLIDRKDGSLKIVDFGIARSLADSIQRFTRSVQTTGTLAYMSPEQAIGRGPNAVDDIYSFGATLYELLTGTPPFFTGEIFSQLQKVPPQPLNERRRERSINEPIPSVWEAVILRCLAKERSQRPQSGAEVLALLGIGGGGNYVAPRPGAMPGTDGLNEISNTPFAQTTGGGQWTQGELPTPPTRPHLPPGQLPTTASMPTHAPRTGTAPAPFDPATRVPVRDMPLGPTTGEVSTVAPIISVTTIDGGGTRGRTVVGQTMGYPPPPQIPKKGSNGLLFAIIGLVVLGGLGAGGYFAWDRGLIPGLPARKKPFTTTTTTTTGGENPTSTGGTSTTGQTTAANTDSKEKPPEPPPVVVPSKYPPAGSLWEVPKHFPTIQAAVDAAGSDKEQPISIEKGSYAGPIVLKSGVSLIGAGADSVTIHHDPRTGPVIAGNQVKGVKISGITFQPDSEEMIKSSHPLARFEESSVTIENCVFRRAGSSGLMLTGEGNSTIKGSKFEECGQHGGQVLAKAKANFTDCTFLNNEEFGLVLVNVGTSAEITEGHFTTNGKSGLELTEGSTANVKKSDATGNGYAGVLVHDAGSSATLEGLTSTENKIAGCQVDGGANAVLTECNLSKNEVAGLVLRMCGKVTLSGGSFSENLRLGIVIEAKDETKEGTCGAIQISKAKVAANGMAGIFVQHAGSAPDIALCDIGPNGRNDIIFTAKSGGSAKSNILRTGANPIVIDGESTAVQADNTLQPASP